MINALHIISDGKFAFKKIFFGIVLNFLIMLYCKIYHLIMKYSINMANIRHHQECK